MMHNWQNTGSQKQQFAYATLLHATPQEKEVSLKYSSKHFLCPVCRSTTETAMHFVTCPSLISLEATKKLRSNLQTKLQNLSTYDGLIDLILFILCGGKGSDHKCHNFNQKMQELWVTARDSQNEIGWISFLQGFWHIDWMAVQRQHLQYLKKDQQLHKWGASVIHELLKYNYECWKTRNEFLHKGQDDAEKRIELQQTVRRLYLDPDRFLNYTREKRRLFNVPLEKKLKCSTSTLESWIDIVELRLRLDREENARRTIVRWLRYKSDRNP